MVRLLWLLQAAQGHCPYQWGPDHLALCRRQEVSGSSTVAEIEVGRRRRLQPCPVDVDGPHLHAGWAEIPGIPSSVGDTVVT